MAGSITKNMGQIAGLNIGSTPPENILLIWYDDTPSQRCHKVYNPSTKLWGALDPEIVSVITYSELVNAAKTNGLPIGKFYQISDRSNVLAFAITTTKVQYTDSLGNILIDDLGTNVQYHVSSSNLLIDDLQGVFDSVNKKLVFRFDERVPNYSEDYIFGKSKVGTKWSLAKFKLSSLLSTVTGNAITWNGGFFFNFSQSLKDMFDKKGGVVSKDTYDKDVEAISQSLNNVGKENQNIITNADKKISDATTDSAIYGKKLPADPVVAGAPGDAKKGDTFTIIISNFQRYINQFKYATGIKLSHAFADSKVEEWVNNNDSVESAFGKVQYLIKHIGVSGKLSSDWVPEEFSSSVALPSAGDSLDKAFAKAVAKFNQIGDISNGQIQSKATTSGGSRRTALNLASASLMFNRDGNYGHNVTVSSSSGLNIRNSDNYGLNADGDSLDYVSQTQAVFDIPAYEKGNMDHVKGGASALVRGKAISTAPGFVSLGIISALSAVCDWNGLTAAGGYQVFDAYFANFKAGGLSLGLIHLSSVDLYLDSNCSFVSCTNTENKNVFLPADPHDGQFIIVNQVNSANIAVHGNGRRICDDTNVDSVNVGAARRCAVFVFNPNIATEAGYKWGMWVFERWSR